MENFFREINRTVERERETDVLSTILSKKIYLPNGLFLEFGVGCGKSINLIARKINPNRIFGFDSFEGYPDNWTKDFPKGSTKQKILPMLENNVEISKGMFNNTIPIFIDRYLAGPNSNRIVFLHLDCNLYVSTSTVLTLLNKYLLPGVVIIISNCMNYDGWENHSMKSFYEFISNNNLRYQVIGYNDKNGTNPERIAIKLIEDDSLLNSKHSVISSVENRLCNLIIVYHRQDWMTCLLNYILDKLEKFLNIYIVYDPETSTCSRAKDLSLGKVRKMSKKINEEISNRAFLEVIKTLKRDKFIFCEGEPGDQIHRILLTLKTELNPCFFIQDTAIFFHKDCITNLIDRCFLWKEQYSIFIPNLINGGIVDFLHQKIGASGGSLIPIGSRKRIMRSAVARDVHVSLIQILDNIPTEIRQYSCFEKYVLHEYEDWEPIFFLFVPRDLTDEDIDFLEKEGFGYLLRKWPRRLQKPAVIVGDAIASNFSLFFQKINRFDLNGNILSRYQSHAESSNVIERIREIFYDKYKEKI